MKAFREIKRELYEVIIRYPERESKYGIFLDKLATEYDRRGEDELWDLWYFSLNTDFCRNSATHFLDEIRGQVAAYRKREGTTGIGSNFNADRLRMLHGCFCFYLYAAMESFAHEINLFYEMNLRRRSVSITRINSQLAKERSTSVLSKHLQEMLSNPVIEGFLDYRNAIMHGYVYPISMNGDRVGIGDAPRSSLFSFGGQYLDVLDFCEKSHTNVNRLISKGWRCFEIDELSE